MKSKPLASFRYVEHSTIANLPGLKKIMRVKKPRTWQWWMILPAVGESDARCILLRTLKLSNEGHMAFRIECEIVANAEANIERLANHLS